MLLGAQASLPNRLTEAKSASAHAGTYLKLLMKSKSSEKGYECFAIFC